MPDFKIKAAVSDDLDFLPLNAEFDADITDESQDLGVGLGSDDLLIGAAFSENNGMSLGFSESGDMSLGTSFGKDETDIGAFGFQDFVKGGGEGGCDCDKDYNNLKNKPTINNVVVEGDKDGAEYGLEYTIRKSEVAQNRLVLEDSFGNTSGVDLDGAEVDYATYQDVLTFLNS